MTTDLFAPKLTKKEELFNFIRDKGFVLTHEVIEWGIKNMSNRSERNARQLAADGKIRRMTEERKKLIYPYTVREDAWEII